VHITVTGAADRPATTEAPKMTIHLPSFLASLLRMSTVFSGVGLVAQRLERFAEGRSSNREPRGMNG
jgi:hypothetical protein